MRSSGPLDPSEAREMAGCWGGDLTCHTGTGAGSLRKGFHSVNILSKASQTGDLGRAGQAVPRVGWEGTDSL